MKKTEILPDPLSNPCYCCGVEVTDPTPVTWFGGGMKVWLCSFCRDAKFVWTDDGYWIFDCPFHGQEDIKGMVAYWDALELFNDKAKEVKQKTRRGPRIKRGVDWQVELEKLRDAYKCLL